MPPIQILNSFRTPATASQQIDVSSEQEAQRVARLLKEGNAYYVLGAACNVLFVEPHFDGIIVHPASRVVQVLDAGQERVRVKVGAAVDWDQLVAWTADNNLWGIECLSGIPGAAGASPVQNIGAYGAALADTLVAVHAYDLQKETPLLLTSDELQLGYRTSIFKGELANRAIILAIELQLSGEKIPSIDYSRIENRLANPADFTPREVREAVLATRNEKLPDPRLYGNAGSFFKNPEITPEELAALQEDFPQVPTYAGKQGNVKIAAGWIIDQCGWKGKGTEKVQVHPKQALIITNKGGATGEEIYQFSQRIMEDVYVKSGICLEREVNVVKPKCLQGS